MFLTALLCFAKLHAADTTLRYILKQPSLTTPLFFSLFNATPATPFPTDSLLTFSATPGRAPTPSHTKSPTFHWHLYLRRHDSAHCDIALLSHPLALYCH
jgi:hypothetical protein